MNHEIGHEIAHDDNFVAFEPGADDKPQAVAPGLVPVTQAERDRHAIDKRRNAPMRGGNRPADFGLFGDDHHQLDLMDSIKGARP